MLATLTEMGLGESDRHRLLVLSKEDWNLNVAIGKTLDYNTDDSDDLPDIILH
jgi:hypothetical protein